MSLRFEISMSLDGYVAGPRPSMQDPLGVGGEALHRWIVGLEAWRRPHGMQGGEVTASSELVERNLARVGATIMGRRMFGGGPGPWGDDPWRGWWGDEPPFNHPVFVLTHHEREPLVLGGTAFTFVTEGPDAALEQATAAAGDRDVQVSGGADAARQYLAAGLLDEVQINLAPVLLGGGTPLFQSLPGLGRPLEPVDAVVTPAVTHLIYRAR